MGNHYEYAVVGIKRTIDPAASRGLVGSKASAGARTKPKFPVRTLYVALIRYRNR